MLSAPYHNTIRYHIVRPKTALRWHLKFRLVLIPPIIHLIHTS